MEGSSRYLRKPSRIAIGSLLVVAGLIVLILNVSVDTPDRAAAAGADPVSRLEINGQTGSVDVQAGAMFGVVFISDITPKVGYVGAQAWLAIGPDLEFISVKALWPDCHPQTYIVNSTATSAYGGCLTFVGTPFDSFYAGSMFEFNLTCTAELASIKIDLVPLNVEPAQSSGTGFATDGGLVASPPTSITVNCIPPLPEPGDTDGDGCSDQRELGMNRMTGGQRDFLNPWDFYDVAITGGVQGQDKQIDLFNDIVSVIDHYAPTGLEPEYDAWYDRGPVAGPNDWNMTAPDGKIDLFNDIVGVMDQFGHDCR